MKLILILATAILLPSCATFTSGQAVISPEGCLLYKKLDNNQKPYYAGTCLNGSHIIQWTQADESYVRVVYTKDDKVVAYIKPKDGEWTRLRTEDGVPIPGLPPGADSPSSGPIK